MGITNSWDFEDGTLGDWTIRYGSPTVDATAALRGSSYGVKMEPLGNTDTAIAIDLPHQYTTMWLSFDMYSNGLSSQFNNSDLDIVRLCYGQNTFNTVLEILSENAGSNTVFDWQFDGQVSTINFQSGVLYKIVLEVVVHPVWGSVRLWQNDELVLHSPKVDLGSDSIDRIEIGLRQSTGALNVGAMYFDNIQVSDRPFEDTYADFPAIEQLEPESPLQKPSGPVEINWDSPLSRGLRWLFWVDEDGCRDLVSGARPTSWHSDVEIKPVYGQMALEIGPTSDAHIDMPPIISAAGGLNDNITVASIHTLNSTQNGVNAYVVENNLAFRLRHNAWNNREFLVGRQWGNAAHNQTNVYIANHIYRTSFSHVGGTMDAGPFRMCLDGDYEEEAEETAHTISSDLTDIVIGNRYSAKDSPLDGAIYMIAVWDVEWQEAQHTAWYRDPYQLVNPIQQVRIKDAYAQLETDHVDIELPEIWVPRSTTRFDKPLEPSSLLQADWDNPITRGLVFLNIPDRVFLTQDKDVLVSNLAGGPPGVVMQIFSRRISGPEVSQFGLGNYAGLNQDNYSLYFPADGGSEASTLSVLQPNANWGYDRLTGVWDTATNNSMQDYTNGGTDQAVRPLMTGYTGSTGGVTAVDSDFVGRFCIRGFSLKGNSFNLTHIDDQQEIVHSGTWSTSNAISHYTYGIDNLTPFPQPRVVHDVYVYYIAFWNRPLSTAEFRSLYKNPYQIIKVRDSEFVSALIDQGVLSTFLPEEIIFHLMQGAQP